MSKAYKSIDDLKRKLREIKKFEHKIRSENNGSSEPDLVWNKFFDLKNNPKNCLFWLRYQWQNHHMRHRST